MKIKRRTEVTIVTHEIFRRLEVEGDIVVEELSPLRKELCSGEDTLGEVEEEGEEHEADRNDS